MVVGDSVLGIVSELIMLRMADCVKGDAREGRERRCGCRPAEGGGGGREQTKGMAKGVKTAVDPLMAMANLDKLGDI